MTSPALSNPLQLQRSVVAPDTLGRQERTDDSAIIFPHHKRRLDTEIAVQYGPQANLAQVYAAWRPFRSWGAFYLRALRERTHEIGSPPTT